MQWQGSRHIRAEVFGVCAGLVSSLFRGVRSSTTILPSRRTRQFSKFPTGDDGPDTPARLLRTYKPAAASSQQLLLRRRCWLLDDDELLLLAAAAPTDTAMTTS